jgi:hypothetical protein
MTRMGFWQTGQRSGSTRHIVTSTGDTRRTIPRANPVDPCTMGAIARDAGLTPDGFRHLL